MRSNNNDYDCELNQRPPAAAWTCTTAASDSDGASGLSPLKRSLPRLVTSSGAVAQISTPPKVFAVYATVRGKNWRPGGSRVLYYIILDNSNLKGNKNKFNFMYFSTQVKNTSRSKKKIRGLRDPTVFY
ncbi:hypothetical protein QTP88_024470 [Uroleucon formosanum]